ncbi:methyltransferase domain-containing protein [bacterium]|nr:methyltransferase domain-containing protein [bacterium]
MASTWNPDQYNRFREQRRQPFLDLIALLEPVPSPRLVDLGCGTGELTRLLHDRLPGAETLGVDSSETMLIDSAGFAAPGLRFARRDVATFAADAAYDIIVSNAALHWLADHAALFARLARALTDRGQLAVQMPFNYDYPSHVVADAVAAEPPFREALAGFAVGHPVHAPEWYAALLQRLGFARQHVRLQVYAHLLETREDVIEWVRGSLLTAYQQRLPPDLWPRFLARYRERLLPELADGRPFFYPFKRLLLWGQR